MVPTFGMFDFIPVQLANIGSDEAEREAYLSEVSRLSTQFGIASRSEAEAHIEDSIRFALMHRF